MASTRPPGMNDVARLAGVSHQTVSRVLNDHANVKPDTRDRVMAAIEELGYRRNLAARALVTQRTGVIGVITTGNALFGPQRAMIAIEEAAREAGYFVSMATVKRPSGRAMRELLGRLLAQGVDGFVVIAPQQEVLEALKTFNSPVPVVAVGAEDQVPSSMQAVSLDQLEGARLAVRHLAGLGHKEIAHISGPLDWTDARARLEGWKVECAELGINPVPLIQGDWSSERGYEIGTELVRAGAPTAVFAANDMIALGVIRAFTEAGLRVPEDVSVVGVDDVPGANNFLPPLTTVHHKYATLGATTIESLLRVIGGGDPQNSVISPELVVRSSTAAPIR